MKKWKSLLTYATVLWLGHSSVEAATIVYVPQDDRPVSLSYTVATAEYAGYKVLTPPVHLISGSNFKGYPDEIWTWLEGNIYQADAVVLSTDTLIYGGLVDSRKHTVPLNILERRISRLNQQHLFMALGPLCVLQELVVVERSQRITLLLARIFSVLQHCRINRIAMV